MNAASMPARALDAGTAKAIARAFLPSRYHYHYARAKLGSDPLYPGVIDALRGTGVPLLDLGCGIGLLAHYLDACGNRVAYRGLDNDGAKIAQARLVAGRAGLGHVHFEVADLAFDSSSGAASPRLAHQGSVAILDVLQFLPPSAQEPLLRAAAACVAPGGRLVIRTGLAGHGARPRITRAVDWLSRVLRWMNTGPKAYPERAALASLLADRGLRSTFTPLWGGTPFNNWLLVAEHSSGGSGTTQR